MSVGNLSSRVGRYIGVNEKSAWGPKALGLGIEALSGHSAWATGVTDFGELAIPNVTALGAAPLSWTASATPGANAHSVVCNSSNGYLLITAGDADVTGYSLQAQAANVPALNQTMIRPVTSSAAAVTNVSLATGREFFWGARIAISCTAAWASTTGGAAFIGMSTADTALMTPLTGALDGVTNCWGFHFQSDGTISLVKMLSSALVTSTLATTATTLAHTSSSYRARDFHDFAVYGKWVVAAGTVNAGNILEGYLDGNLVASLNGISLPNLTATSISCSTTFELLNGTAGDSTMAVASVVTAVPRYHALYGQ